MTVCGCGRPIRTVLHGHVPVRIDEDPVVGGQLLVNVDRIVGRLSENSARQDGLQGRLGFCEHRCPPRSA